MKNFSQKRTKAPDIYIGCAKRKEQQRLWIRTLLSEQYNNSAGNFRQKERRR
jgi:hypothetical protein